MLESPTQQSCPPPLRRDELAPAPASAPQAGSPATASGRVAPVPGRLAQAGSFALRLLAGAYLLIVLVTVVFYKATFVELLTADPFFVVYGVVVCLYIVTRFIFSWLNRSARTPASSRASRW